MNRYKEIKQIAKCMTKIMYLIEKLEKGGFDADGIDWTSAEFVSLDKEDIRHFENTNGVTEDYYVDQWTGYCEDDYFGYLYFKTDVNGQYVKVHFEM